MKSNEKYWKVMILGFINRLKVLQVSGGAFMNLWIYDSGVWNVLISIEKQWKVMKSYKKQWTGKEK